MFHQAKVPSIPDSSLHLFCSMPTFATFISIIKSRFGKSACVCRRATEWLAAFTSHPPPGWPSVIKFRNPTDENETGVREYWGPLLEPCFRNLSKDSGSLLKAGYRWRIRVPRQAKKETKIATCLFPYSLPNGLILFPKARRSVDARHPVTRISVPAWRAQSRGNVSCNMQV